MGPIVECKHFRHPADEQLRILDISSNNNLPSVLFDFIFKSNHSTLGAEDPRRRNNFSFGLHAEIREFKIRRLRTTTTDKHATTHDQNHVTVRFSRVVLRLR